MMMQVNGHDISIDGDTVTIDGQAHHLPPSETLEVDGMLLTRDANGAFRAQAIDAGPAPSRSSGAVYNVVNGAVAGTVFQAGTVRNVNIQQ